MLHLQVLDGHPESGNAAVADLEAALHRLAVAPRGDDKDRHEDAEIEDEGLEESSHKSARGGGGDSGGGSERGHCGGRSR
jgi:hypothetical protein